MNEDKLDKISPAPGEETTRVHSAAVVRGLKPVGCVMVLGCFILLLVICFSSGRNVVKDYVPPMDSSYYAENLSELKAELEENLFPRLEGIVSCTLSGGKLEIVIESESFIASRASIVRYYDRELFNIVSR